MPFSFNPGQDQSVVQPQQANNGVPTLVVPSIPTINVSGNTEEKISPFAFRNRSKSKFGVYFQSSIFLIFGIIFLSSVGLFVYQSILKVQISSKKTALQELQAGFKKPPIDEMLKLSSRISLINKIMNERASVRTALTVVEESVNPTVIYNKFSLSKSKKDNYYDLYFAGETNSYDSLYQQIEILKSKTFAGAFPKILISGIGPLDKKGMTGFKVSASVAIAGVDPDNFTVIYKNSEGVTTTPEVVLSSTTTESINQASSSIVNVVQ